MRQTDPVITDLRVYIFMVIRIVSLLVLAFTLLCTIFIPDIRYRSEITEYFSDTDPHLIQFRALESAQGSQESLLLLIDFGDASAISTLGLTQLSQLESLLKALPDVVRIQSIMNTAITGANQETRALSRLLKQQPVEITDEVLGQVTDNARAYGTLISSDESIATLKLSFANAEVIQARYRDISALVASWEQATDHHVLMLGPVEIKQALNAALLHDGVYLMPFILLCGLGILWFFLRSVWLVTAGAASIVVALWLTAGVTGLLQFSLNQTSVLAFCVAFVIALADIIHLLMGYRHYQQQGGEYAQPQLAMQATLRKNGVSLLLTSVTTGLGFLSLNGSSSPVFATFGNIAALGVAFAFISAISITPALVLLAPPQLRHASAPAFATLLARVQHWRTRLVGIRLGLVYLLSIGLGAGMLLIQYHNDPLDYFQTNSPISRATQLSEQQFGIHHPLTLQLDSGTADGIFEARFLSTLTAFSNWLETQPHVSQVSSFMTTLTQLQRHLHEGNLQWQSPPLAPNAAADLWNLYQMSAPGNTPDSIGVDSKFQRALISVGVAKTDSESLLALERAIHAWFQTYAPDRDIAVSGHAMLFAGIGKELVQQMLMGGLITALVISALIGIFLRNLRLGWLSLIPNLLPIGVVYGVWGYWRGSIDIAAAGTLSISIGIIVDDTIHILKRYRDQRLAGMTAPVAIEKTLEQVGPALVLTTLVLGTGMAILMLSIFGPNQTTAGFLATTIVVALLYDLLILPDLLVRCDRWLFPLREAPPQSGKQAK